MKNKKSRAIDITGMKLHHLTAIKPIEDGKLWQFRCDCGNVRNAIKGLFVHSNIKTCSKYCQYHRGYKTHNLSNTMLYRRWQAMKARCLNKKSDRYKNYAERGIKICDRWLNSFENFLADMGQPPSSKHSIDRIDNNGDYEPSNCKWATQKEQSRNKTTTNFITYKGKTQSLAEWCEELNLSHQLIRNRLFKGWSVERSFATPKIPASFDRVRLWKLNKLTEKQTKCLEEMRQNIKETGKISVGRIARKLNISASLVSYNKLQFIKRGLIKEVSAYEC